MRCGNGLESPTDSQPNSRKAFARAVVRSDVVVFQRPRQDYTIQQTVNGFSVTDKVGAEGTKNVSTTATLQFADQSITLDVDGNAAQIYRVFKAAFNRVPDLDGLGFWIHQMDKGASLLDIANEFVRSAEFSSVYGAAATNAQIVDRYYKNVLGRAGEDDGVTYWNKLLDDRSATTADVLLEFSNSAEKKSTARINRTGCVLSRSGRTRNL